MVDTAPAEVAPAEWADLPQLRQLLAASYAADPLVSWVLPDPVTRQDAAAAWLGLFLEPALQARTVDVVRDDAGDPLALAAWRSPVTGAPAGGGPTVAGLLAALVGVEHAARVGAGLGGAVLGPSLRRAAGAGHGVHLETANPDAVPFYRARGFTVTAQVDLPASGPRLWALTRPAGGKGARGR